LGHGVEFDVNDDEDRAEDQLRKSIEEVEKLPPKIADVDVASAQPLSGVS
jgi:hypothetical protein